MLRHFFAKHLFAAQAPADRHVDLLARQIAELSVDAVCQLVRPWVGAMTMCETRGYVRARAASEIRRQTRLAIARRPGAAAWEHVLVRRATDRLVPMALRSVATGVGVARACEANRAA